VNEAKAAGIYPYFHLLESRQDTEVVMEGKRRIMLGSNNYLGLTVNDRVVRAGINALEEYGTGCSGSRLLNGTLRLHIELERKLAEFLNKEDCVTFSTGFQTNLGIISSLTGRHDYILMDKENHASLYDACRLSYGKMVRYNHNDMDDLWNCLREIPKEKGKIIVTDGVFSMSGDICKLDEIVTLAKQYDARIMVDDAHALGVLGECGRGTAEQFGLEKEVDIIMGTFSKSLASIGGYMVGDHYVVDYVRHNSRPFIFCASIPPAACATAIEALEVLKETPSLVKRLNALAFYLREGLKKRGIGIIESQVPIVPIMTYEQNATMLLQKTLYDSGVYVNTVLPPAVPAGECMLRISLMASHTYELLDESMDIIARVINDM
jgi:8-amino-7-oxononanoate synthase